jgi:hypothetical protein
MFLLLKELETFEENFQETVNKLLEKVCLVTKISFKYFIFKKFCGTDKKLELLFLLGHILQSLRPIGLRTLTFLVFLSFCLN